jgi:hypothetical protein
VRPLIAAAPAQDRPSTAAFRGGRVVSPPPTRRGARRAFRAAALRANVPRMRTLAALAALLLPALAAPQPTLAARLAFAPAVGDVAANLPVGDALVAQLPLQLDGLWRTGPFSAGAYASFGLGRTAAPLCADGAGCSGSSVRAGVQAIWGFPAPPRWPAPWTGAGIGWEWTSWRRERLGSETSWRYGGPEAFLQGGAEWPLGQRVALGPFALVGLGRYTTASLDTAVASASADLGERAFHAWIHLGVRCRVDL